VVFVFIFSPIFSFLGHAID